MKIFFLVSIYFVATISKGNIYDSSIIRKTMDSTFTLESIILKSDKLSNLILPGYIELDKFKTIGAQGLLEDPIFALSKFPGISRSGDLFIPGQLYIRGGDRYENIFLYDNGLINWPWLFGGQKSIYNTSMIKNIELMTGGFPASYGNALSSIVNIVSDNPDNKEFGIGFNVGIYNAGLHCNIPLIKNKFSFKIASRITYLDKIIKKASFPLNDFIDFNIKLNYDLNENNKISFSQLLSNESLSFTPPYNATFYYNLFSKGTKQNGILEWQSKFSNSIYNKLIFNNNTTEDSFKIGNNNPQKLNTFNFQIRNDLSIYINNNKVIKTGFEYVFTNFKNKEYTTSNNMYLINENGKLNRFGLYALYEGNLVKKITTNLGIRFDYKTNFPVFSPRIKFIYTISSKHSLHINFGHYHQFIEPIYADFVNQPSNFAIHYIAGYSYKISNSFQGWIEYYFKDYNRLNIKNMDGSFNSKGKGFSNGIEMFLSKNKGWIQGWISYAYNQSKRTYNSPNTIVVSDFEQPHIFNINIEFHLKSSFWLIPQLIQFTYRYESGIPYTSISKVNYNPSNKSFQVMYNAYNAARFSANQNLQCRIEWISKFTKNKFFRSYFEVWNLLNYANIIQDKNFINYRFSNTLPNNYLINFTSGNDRLIGGGFIFDL